MTDAQKYLALGAVLLAAWLLYLLAPVLTPFLAGAILAYLGDPLADRLENLRLSRTLAVVIVFAAMVIVGMLLLLIIIPLLQNQLLALAARLPSAIDWLQKHLLPYLSNSFGVSPRSIDLGAIKNALAHNWRDVGNILGYLLGRVGHSGMIVLAWLTYLLLVPVVTFYLLRDWDILVARVRALLPRRYEATVVALAQECDSVLAQFLRGQLLVMLALGTIYSVGLWIAGLEFSLLVGMLAGLVSFVPYLGAIVGICTAGILAFMQFHDFLHLIYVGVVFGIGQTLEGTVLSPNLVGERIGLHPVAVIFAVLAGGRLFGFFGVLLALPAAAVITVLLRYAHQRYLDSRLYMP